MKVLLCVVLNLFWLAVTPSLLAQVTVEVTAPGQNPVQSNAGNVAHAPDPDTGMSGRVEGLYIPTIAGQPFQAKVVVSITRQLADGTAVAQKYYTLVARDGQGRVHREFRELLPADSAEEPALLWTIVYDPVASLITTCYPERRSCRHFALAPPPAEVPVGPSPGGKSVLRRESIGSKTFDGLAVDGTRETLTFAPETFGNDKPVVVTKDYWYSPRLQVNLLVTRNDPRNGTQRLEVTELKLGEPGTEWFTVPDGYRVVAEQVVNGRSMYPAELEPLIEKEVPGMSPDALRTALAPVEAAIGAYAKAHAEAAPYDRIDEFAGRMRSQLSMDLRMLQQNNFPQRVQQFGEADKRLNETYQQVVTSPCMDKTEPGDPAMMPKDAAGLREEERAWVGLRDAWAAFLAKLFPNADPQSFLWLMTNQRDNELRRMQNVERNRGCTPEESIEPMLANFVTGMSGARLAAAVKPVDAAISAYAKAHAEAAPNDHGEFFLRMVQMNLVEELRMQQQDQLPTRDEFEDADLRLNQAWRVVIASPCLGKTIPADPPNAPVGEEQLRAEERAWIAMRDAWTAFMTQVYPNAGHAGFGTMLTQQRVNELQQMKVVLRNRGCKVDEKQ